MAEAYKLHMLQAQQKARQASLDVGWIQNHARETRAGVGYAPDWRSPCVLDSARPFPGVPYNPDTGMFYVTLLMEPFANDCADQIIGPSSTFIPTPNAVVHPSFCFH
jgi:hypothetical protein